MLVLAVPAVLGLQVAGAILFPLLFLFFAVPMGEFMLPTMMNWTADFTVAALRLSGVPVYREGLQFVIPSGNWSVVEACSGVRYLIASFMVGTLFAHLNYRSWKRRALFMAVSIAVPIVANWLRAYGIVMLGHLSGNTIAVGVDHLVYGWVFFGIVIMIMFLVGARWSEPDAVPAQAAAGSGLAGAAGPGSLSVLPVAVATAAVLLLPHLALWGLQRVEQSAAAPQLALPAQLAAPWQADDAAVAFRPHFEGPAAQVAQAYAGPEGRVGVYLAYYRNQADGSKLVSSLNAVVRADDPDWNDVNSSALTQALGGRQIGWRTARILGASKAGGARRPQLVAWHVYWIDGRWVAGDVQAKLVGALQRLQGRGDDGAALVLWTDNDSPAAGRATLEAFAKANLPALEALLQQTRDAR